jgi:hypothetical protein
MQRAKTNIHTSHSPIRPKHARTHMRIIPIKQAPPLHLSAPRFLQSNSQKADKGTHKKIYVQVFTHNSA